MKYLLLLLLVAVLWWSFRRPPPAKRENKDIAQKAAEEIRRCEYCGVHFPVSDGEEVAGSFYCSSEHRRAAGR